MSKIAEYTITIKGKTLQEVYADWGKYETRGLTLKSMTVKRLWPKFWIKEYTVVLNKYVVVEIIYDGDGAIEAVNQLKRELL